MDINRENLLREIMAADFFCYDMALYLNTHPTDQRALFIYHNNAQRARMLRSAYETNYGPLTAQGSSNPNVWQWIEGPWPWEGM